MTLWLVEPTKNANLKIENRFATAKKDFYGTQLHPPVKNHQSQIALRMKIAIKLPLVDQMYWEF